RVLLSSYADLSNKFGLEHVCSLGVINSYYSNSTTDYVDENDSIYWIRMQLISDPIEPFFAPLQFVISGSDVLFPEKRHYVPAAVSTGTACHEDVEQALNSALIEVMQIDSFELWWYGGLKGKPCKIEQAAFLKQFFKDSEIADFLENFSLRFTDISFDKNIFICVCEIFGKNKGLPKYTVGVQGGLNRDRVLYRSLMEALSVLEYNMGLPWMNYETWNSIAFDSGNISNFDNNVIKYSKFGKPDLKINKNSLCFEGNSDSVLSYIKDMCPESGYLVMTAPEFDGLNLDVVRVFVPGLVPLSLPSYPPLNHPRFKKIGGIQNYVAHPLA
ncbi:MAG: YcaO-like family protein, partial [Eggerthellaceae bacterium]|nr:YcaO-like family protein [Eggerthellaceae bacterium]